MVFKKSLKGILAGLLIGAGALMPSEGVGASDNLKIINSSFGSTIVRTGEMYQKHSSEFLELADTWDVNWSNAPPSYDSYDKFLKIDTSPYGESLYSDGRPTQSESKFFVNLSVVDKVGENISSSNRLGFYFYTSDTNRHYTAKIHCDTNYTPNHVSFDKWVNIREVIANDSGYVNLPGITNAPDGTIYATVDMSPQFNRLVSSHSGNGSNSFEGNVVVNYNSNTNIGLNADSGNYVDYYVLTRTDNTGSVSVVTNDFVGTGVTSTNIPIESIKGSNSIYAVYAPLSTTFSVSIENGSKYGLSPTNFSNVPSGGSVTSSTSQIYYTNSPGIRTKITGLERKL